MVRWHARGGGTVAVAAGVAGLLVAACTPAVSGDPLKAPTAGEAFEGVQCSAVRPQTEPDLMAWDSGSRANLSRLRRSGIVAVRYAAKGCNVELELLSNCIGGGAAYTFSPYSANEHKVAHNASELFAQLPVGAANLSGKVAGTKSLRTECWRGSTRCHRTRPSSAAICTARGASGRRTW